MVDRARRQSRLLSLLTSRVFSKQGEIVAAMKAEGFDVTQSSISRDFHDLNVVKAAGRYVPMGGRDAAPPKLGDLVGHVDTAGPNLIVVKTPIGAADVVAVALDGREIEGMVGTVAGDDTILIATKNRAAQGRIIEALRRLE